jgi:hypothetical protein
MEREKTEVAKIIEKSSALLLRILVANSQRHLRRAVAIALLATPLPVVAAPAPMTLGGIVRTALPGCDAATPVAGADGAIYSNVSDCTVTGSPGKVSTGWVKVDPSTAWVSSNLTDTGGNGASGRKLSGAVVDGGTLYLLERNLTTSGGMRVGRSASVAQPNVTWGASLSFGWGSFAQGSPDGYQYIYLRDAPTAYGTADRVALVRVPKGSVTNLATWQVFAGSSTAPSWVSWTNRAARRPVLSDPGRINRPYVSYLGGCWTMAVTMPALSSASRGNGLAVYTSLKPYGPWNRRYYVTGKDLGEGAQFSLLWPGRLLLTEGDRFTWRSYSMPSGGC